MRTPGSPPLWPIALGALARVLAASALPAEPLPATDEESYFGAAVELVDTGARDPFWPPVVPWLVALTLALGRGLSLAPARGLWVALDVGCLFAARALAGRVARATSGDDAGLAARIGTAATVAHALWPPSLGYAGVVTSETPALLLALVAVLLAVPEGGAPTLGRLAGAGAAAGALALTRPSLLPLLFLLPLAAPSRRALALPAVGLALVGGFALAQGLTQGEPRLSRNAAFDLALANRDDGLEELDLFAPRATEAQIAARRDGYATPPRGEPAANERAAARWVREHPGAFARRLPGRLARLFVPRTDLVRLAGPGSPRRPAALALLAGAAAAWGVALAAGLAGLVGLARRAPALGRALAALVAAVLPASLAALSKPRYGYVFEPALVACAAAALCAPARAREALGPRARAGVAAALAFVAWGWVAWAVFTSTARP